MEVIASSGLGCWEGESHLLDHFHRTKISSQINSQPQHHRIHKHHQDLLIQSSLISFFCCYKYPNKKLKKQRAYTGSQFECPSQQRWQLKYQVADHMASAVRKQRRWSLVLSSFSQPRERYCLQLRWVFTPQLTQSRKSLEDIRRQ